MTQRNLLLAAVAGFVLVNGLAFLVVKAVKGAPRAAAAPASEDLERRRRDEEEGHRRRAAGLKALEAADYEKALINLTEAKVLLGDAASVDQLLKVTEDLRRRAPAPAAEPGPPAPASAEPPPPPSSPPAQAAAVPVAPAPEDAARAEAARKAAPRPAPARPARSPGPQVASREPGADLRGEAVTPRPGLLLVTTTPRGLLVQVDGAAVDLTPMRLSLRPGTHRVVLLDGERRLHETQVEVVEGQATTVVRDLSAELGSARAAEAAARPPPSPVEPAGEPARPVPAPAAPAAAAPAVGALEVTSPGLYAEVWINGRAYGFPPVTARELPAGLARIEVRVNGAVKRRAEVEVVAGQVQQVKVR